jgi:hypothetical protein
MTAARVFPGVSRKIRTVDPFAGAVLNRRMLLLKKVKDVVATPLMVAVT